ncbi:MAG: proton-conducting transporter membrane subunit, partial [Candidatus Limnocylindrales bacterium]
SGAPLTSADLQAVAANLRWSALAGGLAIGAVAWANPAVPAIGADRAAFGLADLAIVLAVALRFGAIPFHRPVARLTNTAPGTAIPLVLVWSPAALAVVVTWATDGNTIALLAPSGIGADLIIVGAAVSLILGAIGAWLQDDLGHIVGYSIVQDAGFVLLGLAAGGADSGQHARTWLLILVVAKTAFATWATVIEARFRTARLPELNGWARRSPILGVALVGITVATIGLPGLLAWQTRTALVEAATGGPLAIILQVGGLASLAYYGRIIAAGLARPVTLSSAAQSDRPVRPEGGRADLGTARRAWSVNRPPIAAGLVVVLVLLSLAVAVGGLGGPEAAGATGPLASPVSPVSPVDVVPGA